MFEAQSSARVFAVPVGCGFAGEFVAGLLERLAGKPAEAIARVEIFVNSRRMERQVHELLLRHGARLLPRIRLITDIAVLPSVPVDFPAPVSALRRRLQLAKLVKALLELQPDIAPVDAVFDLADSLRKLLDELQGEGVPFEALEDIQTGELSAHWERSLIFLRILSAHWDQSAAVDPQDRLRLAALAFAAKWQETPPAHPIIVAGSTGSRGASALFLRAVARLPQGAVVLPGWDREMPAEKWQALDDPRVTLDHPQSGINKCCRSLGLQPADLPVWTKTAPHHPKRNQLISLALRPAPFTDEWLAEGPRISADLEQATTGMVLVESENAKEEARAIATRLRYAAETGQSAVLISPDRDMTRRVSTILKRWGIKADDSAGRPLHQTPPGIFLRLVANCFGQRLTPLMLITLLKHPLAGRVESGGDARLLARNLERQELRGRAPVVDFERLRNWAANQKDPKVSGWIEWLQRTLAPLATGFEASLQDWIALHRSVAENLASGPNDEGSGILWDKEAGKQARLVFGALSRESDVLENVSATEYKLLFLQLLHEGEVREAETPHPHIAIMGPREAREQSAELVILGGLNEGIWPKINAPDPWLSRSMRRQIGLPLPERQMGLSAHDFQQAIGAKEVVLSRALRDGDAPTVASRWLIRFENLLKGLGDDGKGALASMKDRGVVWSDYAKALDVPEHEAESACRPSPQPPLAARPKRLSVTRIKTLIRDPYAIYAQYILKLEPLRPLGREPDPLVRGIALHKVLESFIGQTTDQLPEDAAALFVETARKVLEKEAPWPAVRRFWLARLARIADWFVATEQQRRSRGVVAVQEKLGGRKVTELDFQLTGKADRIDVDDDGNFWIYDYKSGAPPSAGESRHFDKQLQLEAAIAEAGGFDGLAANKVGGLEYIGLGASAHQSEGKIAAIEVEDDLVNRVWGEFRRLITSYHRVEQGYTARSRMQKTQDSSDYDHLSRRGEWKDTDDPHSEQVP